MSEYVPYLSLAISVLVGAACAWLYRHTRRQPETDDPKRAAWERGITARLNGHDAQIKILERALVTEDPRGVKPTTTLERPTDQALADAAARKDDVPPAPSRSARAVAAQMAELRGETTGVPVDATGDRAGVYPGDGPATPQATKAGDDGRRTSSRPPPLVMVLDDPLVTDDEEDEETRALSRDAAKEALSRALETAEPAQPVPSTPRTDADRSGGAKPTAPLHGRRANVPRPDDVRAQTMRPPPAEGVRARMTGGTMGASVVDILPEAHRVGWDLACEVRVDTLIQAATRAGDDVSHCVARGTECGGIMGCRCNCTPCTRRRELEDQAYLEIKGPLVRPLR